MVNNTFVPPFRLARHEVEVFGLGSRISGRSKVRQSRKLDVSSWKFTLTHGATGVQVSGEVAKGHYTRAQFSHLKADLLKKLWSQLEQRVAARLHVSGQ